MPLEICFTLKGLAASFCSTEESRLGFNQILKTRKRHAALMISQQSVHHLFLLFLFFLFAFDVVIGRFLKNPSPLWLGVALVLVLVLVLVVAIALLVFSIIFFAVHIQRIKVVIYAKVRFLYHSLFGYDIPQSIHSYRRNAVESRSALGANVTYFAPFVDAGKTESMSTRQYSSSFYLV